jgi:hypothetical protein
LYVVIDVFLLFTLFVFSSNSVSLASNWLLEHCSDVGINEPISNRERSTLTNFVHVQGLGLGLGSTHKRERERERERIRMQTNEHEQGENQNQHQRTIMVSGAQQ